MRREYIEEHLTGMAKEARERQLKEISQMRAVVSDKVLIAELNHIERRLFRRKSGKASDAARANSLKKSQAKRDAMRKQAKAGRMPWSKEEDDAVLGTREFDADLAQKLGRSLCAIVHRRSRLRKLMQSNG